MNQLNEIRSSQNRSMDKINFLIQNGLGSDISRLSYYRQIIQNPQQAIQSVIMRKYAAEVLNNLLGFVFSDSVMYNRLRQLLVSSGKHMSKMKPSAFESIMTKAISNNVDIETLIEVYEEGYEDEDRPTWLSKEQHAFNSVNSFIRGDAPKEVIKEDTTSPTVQTIRRIVKRTHNG
jgi:hypothetical protein